MTSLDAARAQLSRFDDAVEDLHARRASYLADPRTAKLYRQLSGDAAQLKNRLMTSLGVVGVAADPDLQADLAGLGVWPWLARVGITGIKWGALGTAIIGAGEWVSRKLALDNLVDKIASGIEETTGGEPGTGNNSKGMRNIVQVGLVGLLIFTGWSLLTSRN